MIKQMKIKDAQDMTSVAAMAQRIRELEATLERQQGHINHIEQTMRLGLWEYDVHTEALTWSPQMYTLYGVPSNFEVTKEAAISFYPEAAHRVIQESFRQAIDDHISWDFELPLITAQGKELWVRSAGKPLLAGDQCVGVYGTLQDITVERSLRLSVHEREERYRVISDMMADYAYSLKVAADRSLEQEWIIGAFERITGYTSNETMAQGGWATLVHPEDIGRVLKVLEYMISHHEQRNYVTQYRIVRKDGRVRFMESVNRPEYDPRTDELVRIYGAARDITDHVRMVEALQHNEELYRIVVQSQSELICQFDNAGNLSFANDAFCRFYGETADVLSGRSFTTLFNVTVTKQFKWAQQAVVNNRIPHSVTSFLTGPDGAGATIEWRFSPLYNALHEVSEVLVVGHNITDRLEAEQKARELEIEQARVKILAEFITHATHEFRTPLTTIGSSAYLMMRAKSTEKRQQRHDMIIEQIDRITNLVDMLARLAALDTLAEVKHEAVDLRVISNQIIDYMQPQIQQKGLRVTVDLPDEIAVVAGSSELIAEAMGHLLNNAMRYNKQGGSIIIRAEQRDDSCQLLLTDTGVGMDAYGNVHLFERFYRGDVAHTTPGLGLGASIAARIVELHGGQIRVRSTLNVGTTVTITLPISQNP